MEYEGTRDLTRCIVHVDMDAYFAAVEMRDDPSLRDIPMAVGGNSMLVSRRKSRRLSTFHDESDDSLCSRRCRSMSWEHESRIDDVDAAGQIHFIAHFHSIISLLKVSISCYVSFVLKLFEFRVLRTMRPGDLASVPLCPALLRASCAQTCASFHVTLTSIRRLLMRFAVFLPFTIQVA